MKEERTRLYRMINLAPHLSKSEVRYGKQQYRPLNVATHTDDSAYGIKLEPLALGRAIKVEVKS